MPHHLRFRGGPVQYVRVPVDSATVITPGDLIWLDSGNAKPASDFTWNTDLATTQGEFAAAFAGVAQSYSAAGETTDVTVDVSPLSVYEVQVPAGSYTLGDALGPDEDSSTLMNEQLESAVATSAIARVMEVSPASATRVRVSFASALHPASANTNATVG